MTLGKQMFPVSVEHTYNLLLLIAFPQHFIFNDTVLQPQYHNTKLGKWFYRELLSGWYHWWTNWLSQLSAKPCFELSSDHSSVLLSCTHRIRSASQLLNSTWRLTLSLMSLNQLHKMLHLNMRTYTQYPEIAPKQLTNLLLNSQSFGEWGNSLNF